MYERIVEIIIYVISELKHNKQISEIDIVELQKRGYSRIEISTAFSWIVDRFEMSDKYYVSEGFMNNDSFRILHDGEKELFTKDALGDLLQLHSLGLLSNEHIEMLIERTIMTGINQIDSNQLKMYVANIIFNAQQNNFPGSRLMLSAEDTIN